MGLAILGGCILGAAALTSHKFGSEAMAQGTGTERRIVSAGMIKVPTRYDRTGCGVVAYRIWSDNAIDLRGLGYLQASDAEYNPATLNISLAGSMSDLSLQQWTTVDNGTSGFRPLTDVDMSGETDAGDISQVLLDFNTRSEDLPPPPMDCSINSPR
jgi:hypothetical protein